MNYIQVDASVLGPNKRIQTETSHYQQSNLNRQVEDLFDCNFESINYQRSRAEFLLGEENFYNSINSVKDQGNGRIKDLNRCIQVPKDFKVKRLTKKKKRAEVILQTFLSNDSTYHSLNKLSQNKNKSNLD